MRTKRRSASGASEASRASCSYSSNEESSHLVYLPLQSWHIPVLSPLRSIPVRRPQSVEAGSKAAVSRPAKRPEGFSLDAAAATGNYAGAVDGEAASFFAFSFNAVK